MPDLQKSIASQHETYMPNIPHHRRLEAGVMDGASCRDGISKLARVRADANSQQMQYSS